jgi:hypothetical protein
VDHIACYPVGNGGCLPGGVERPEREANHSSASSAKVRKDGAVPPLSPIPHRGVTCYLLITGTSSVLTHSPY